MDLTTPPKPIYNLDALFDSRVANKALSYESIAETIRVSKEIIDNLSPKALKELGGSTEADLDWLISQLVSETHACLFGGLTESNTAIAKFNNQNVYYLESLNETVQEVLMQESLIYFILNVMPNFDINWHHVEWCDMVQRYPRLNILAARGHGKSHFFSNAYLAWRLWRYKKNSKRADLSKLSKEGWIFSFSKTQGKRLLTTLKETIKDNPILFDRLYPGGDGWAETKIVCKNGASIVVGSAGESVRGAHPGYIVVDDFLKDNVLYSQEQRQKSTDYFHSVIMNMIEPSGTVIVVGTPFHQSDLYGDLKTKKGWHVREYPSIFPDGRILWSRRFSFKDLIEKKITQGAINFTRENLCRPISNDTSIFPYHILERATVGMNVYTMVNNIESFPVKLVRVCIGVDLAISANIGTDYTVMVVGGIDEQENIWVLNITRLHGASYDEQISRLKKLNFDFRPHIIQIESNGFQSIFAQGAEKEGLPVQHEATTAKTKNDLKTGLPGVSLLFERGKIKVPVGDKNSIDCKDMMFAEFSSITWTNNGLQATSGHDDIPMAFHQLVKGIDYKNTGFGFQFM